MQIATLLYNDRVNTYRTMKVLDQELDNNPTKKAVVNMAETRIRNLQCFEELKSFNDTGKWKNIHPLLVNYSHRFQLEELRKKNPEEFLQKYAACSQNIKRYSSYLKNPSRKDKHDSDKTNLKKHQDFKILFESILKDE